MFPSPLYLNWHFPISDSTGSRVEVAKPVVEMDGDEMTRVSSLL